MFIFSYRWLFAFMGLYIAGIRGAIAGYLLGWAVEYMYGKPKNPFGQQEQQRREGGHYEYRQSEPYRPYANLALQNAYLLLGIAPTATDEEVRQAYRKMALKYHPDKAASQGEEARKHAEKVFQQIGAAKDLIFKARGMS